MSLNYAWEKFHIAVSLLASGTGSIQERLCNAYTGSLIHLEFPSDSPMCDDFEEIVRGLTGVEPVGDEGSVQATTNAMTELKASEIAQKIVSLYDQITRLM